MSRDRAVSQSGTMLRGRVITVESLRTYGDSVESVEERMEQEAAGADEAVAGAGAVDAAAKAAADEEAVIRRMREEDLGALMPEDLLYAEEMLEEEEEFMQAPPLPSDDTNKDEAL